MADCPHCRERFVQVRRKLWERVFYSDAFICKKCRRRVRALRGNLAYLFSSYARCVRCGSYGVSRLMKPDRVDGFTRNPLGLVQRLLGAPVCRCSPCRLQFYDWRRLRD